jgi:chemotaxis protein CheZ
MPPVQRKVFRIEEHVRSRSRRFASVGAAQVQLGEFGTVPPQSAAPPPAERPLTARARAEIAEAQAFKAELVAIHEAIVRTTAEMAALMAGTHEGDQVARVSRELAAIVTGTERATQEILQAAEEIDQSAHALAEALEAGHEQALAHDIQERIVRIFEVCNFQDLTGQRVSNVVTTLTFIEERISRLFEIWHRVEHCKPAAPGRDDSDDSRFLNGPKLAGEGGHATQSEIDEIFFGIGDALT